MNGSSVKGRGNVSDELMMYEWSKSTYYQYLCRIYDICIENKTHFNHVYIIYTGTVSEEV